MIKILTDSTSDISMQYAKQLDVDVIPLKVIINEKEYKDRIDLQPEQFYKLLMESHILPSTSQPSPQDFLIFFEKAKTNNDQVIVITLSSVVSGTYQSACIAKDLCDYDDIYIIDSLSATQGERLIVEKAVSLRQAGKSAQEIYHYIDQFKHRVHLFAVVDTLEYFYKGGRLSKTSATVGTLLKFKPIVGLKDGHLELFSKARGTNKATLKMIELIQETGHIDLDESICIGYTGNDMGLEKFENTLKGAFHFQNPLYGIVGPVIGTHAGPGAKLIAYVAK